MITKRDQDIINFLEEEGFHIATTSQLHGIFFKDLTYRCCAARLEKLTEQEHIKRTQSTINTSYAYYVSKKPVQIHHDLIRTELYMNIKNTYQIMEWHNEYTFLNLRSDAFAYISDHDIVFPCFIEIHLNNRFDFEKYNTLFRESDLKTLFGILPRVIICTDRDITIPKGLGLKFKVVDLEMNGLESLFK
jgi:hypothetical protein